jgi:copper chaperone
MITFEVRDMTCGHCASTITNALKAADRDAKVQIDLTSQRVQVEPNEADAARLAEAIQGAGYTPVPIAAPPTAAGTSAPSQKGRGGCCG